MTEDLLREWNQCLRDSLLMTANEFIGLNDGAGLTGLASLGLSSRVNSATQVAISTLFNESLKSRNEGKKLRNRLSREESKLRELGVYDVMEKRTLLLEEGYVPIPKLLSQVKGFRKEAKEIYWEMKEKGIVIIDEYSLRENVDQEQWVRFPPTWTGFFEEIETKGSASTMFTYLFSTVIDVVITGKGLRNLEKLVEAVMASSENGRQISVDDFSMYLENQKTANIMLQKVMELVQPLRIFEDWDGYRLTINENAIRAASRIVENRNELARRRGLGV